MPSTSSTTFDEIGYAALLNDVASIEANISDLLQRVSVTEANGQSLGNSFDAYKIDNNDAVQALETAVAVLNSTIAVINSQIDNLQNLEGQINVVRGEVDAIEAKQIELAAEHLTFAQNVDTAGLNTILNDAKTTVTANQSSLATIKTEVAVLSKAVENLDYLVKRGSR